jgi:hypothetical protein
MVKYGNTEFTRLCVDSLQPVVVGMDGHNGVMNVHLLSPGPMFYVFGEAFCCFVTKIRIACIPIINSSKGNELLRRNKVREVSECLVCPDYRERLGEGNSRFDPIPLHSLEVYLILTQVRVKMGVNVDNWHIFHDPFLYEPG